MSPFNQTNNFSRSCSTRDSTPSQKFPPESSWTRWGSMEVYSNRTPTETQLFEK